MEEILQMSRPLGVTVLAILQLLGALAMFSVGALALLAALVTSILWLIILAVIPLVIGIIGFILFYGLWNLKSWAWIWTVVVNLLTVIFSLTNISANIISIAISLLIVIYMFSPGIKDHFR
jgi:hypothetical protein